MQCLALDLDQPQNRPLYSPAALVVMSSWKKEQMKEAVEKTVIDTYVDKVIVNAAEMSGTDPDF